MLSYGVLELGVCLAAEAIGFGDRMFYAVRARRHSPWRPGQSGPPLRRFVALSASTARAGRYVRCRVRSRSRWCRTATMRRCSRASARG